MRPRRNQHLKKKNYAPIEDPATAFESGVKLGEIVNALYDIPMPKLNQNPRMRPQQARQPARPPAARLPVEAALVGADGPCARVQADNIALVFKMVEGERRCRRRCGLFP